MEHDDTVSQRGFNEEKLESATAAGVSVRKLLPEVRCFLKDTYECTSRLESM